MSMACPSRIAARGVWGRGWRKLSLLLTTLMIGVIALPCLMQAQKPRKALEKNEVIELLESGVAPDRVGVLARQYGIAFEITNEVEDQLRDAGATDELLATLRQAVSSGASRAPQPAATPPAPPPAGPPVLLIEVTPGGAQTYIDDEPVGTTSSAGRLKLSSLGPGAHRVRLSLAGYRDYEQSVELVAGQTAEVKASLESAAPPPRPPSTTPPASEGSSLPTGEAPGALGVRLARTAPPGTRGAYISDVSPNGPAQRAGLRAGYSIVSFAGRPVSSAEELMQIVTSYRAGAMVQIDYFNGTTVQTTTARLGHRASITLPPDSQAPSPGPGQPAAMPIPNIPPVQFSVAHDHGPPAPNFCVGVMTIGNGMIQYRSANGVHSFDIPLDLVKEAKRNAVYMAMYGAFHIRLKRGTNFNFTVINSSGQHQPPDALLQAIGRAMGGR
jgi:hypothetical protein